MEKNIYVYICVHIISLRHSNSFRMMSSWLGLWNITLSLIDHIIRLMQKCKLNEIFFFLPSSDNSYTLVYRLQFEVGEGVFILEGIHFLNEKSLKKLNMVNDSMTLLTIVHNKIQKVEMKTWRLTNIMMSSHTILRC